MIIRDPRKVNSERVDRSKPESRVYAFWFRIFSRLVYIFILFQRDDITRDEYQGVFLFFSSFRVRFDLLGNLRI